MVVDTVPKDILDLLGTGVAVTGTFWQSTQPVSGTFWQSTQPVTQTATKTLNVYSFWETLPEDATRKLLAGSAGGETTTIYTVPSGKKVYVTSMSISLSNDDSSADVTAWILIAGTEVLSVKSGTATVSRVGNNSVSFPIPIVVAASETIQIKNLSSAEIAYGQIQGYEVSI